ncbi:ABC transporter ATP-binding protein [Roseomonas xinghualingensis]|uniref:ABC transporter ATP-binding protein n=1 Tax=Roseomonas xinghualingensis TaxID=2986475 RepID=UPI0021F1393D|nr:ABC transporter ATP-binding protein [Roseomonas sp. SXEYE001]MCV4209836.1 ABC transporter ATP-binding protein [Roseomonas sp. SXEYE001]
MPDGSAVATTAKPGLTVRLRAAGPIPLDLDLACAPGEVLALVGPSGAGKSTALRCLAGLHRPETGRVICNDAVWLDTGTGVDLPPHRRAVGMVFQDYALFPHMTALGNVAAAMGHLPRGRRHDRARELLTLVRLSGLEERRPAEMSGGQQQRVAVARALARDPAVLLLDEPFSAVDRATRRQLQEELAALRRVLSIPVLLVTHDLEEAAALGDRICVLHHGRGLQTAPAAELLARPVSAEVARLLDLRNIFRGKVERHDPTSGVTLLRWGERTVRAEHAPAFAPGETVDWLVAGAAVIPHPQDLSTACKGENSVVGQVSALVGLGGAMRVTLKITSPEGGTLSFDMPLHAARTAGLVVDKKFAVALLRDGIHLMRQIPTS